MREGRVFPKRIGVLLDEAEIFVIAEGGEGIDPARSDLCRTPPHHSRVPWAGLQVYALLDEPGLPEEEAMLSGGRGKPTQQTTILLETEKNVADELHVRFHGLIAKEI
jgi:hypothetical protein